MPNNGARYSDEFKAEAVKLYRSSGKGIREVSAGLGVASESLRAWVKQDNVEEGLAQGLTTAERDGAAAAPP